MQRVLALQDVQQMKVAIRFHVQRMREDGSIVEASCKMFRQADSQLVTK